MDQRHEKTLGGGPSRIRHACHVVVPLQLADSTGFALELPLAVFAPLEAAQS
jgi:hypothetical protein